MLRGWACPKCQNHNESYRMRCSTCKREATHAERTRRYDERRRERSDTENSSDLRLG